VQGQLGAARCRFQDRYPGRLGWASQAETIRNELDLEIIAPSSHTRQQRTAPLLSSSAGTTVASVFLRADWYENSSLRGSGM